MPPSILSNTSLKSVEYLYRDEIVISAIVNREVGHKTITDYIICQEDETKTLSIPNLDLNFVGRFAIVRRN